MSASGVASAVTRGPWVVNTLWTMSTLSLLTISAAGCSSSSNQLEVQARDESSLTVHDISDGEPFVSSGIRICTKRDGAVTLTDVQPSGRHSGITVTGFDTLLAHSDDQTIPISVRGPLSDVTARSGERKVDDPCAGDTATEELTFIAWQVSGFGAGPGSAERFTLTYQDERGHVGKVEVPVTITLCEKTETTGVCRD
jgi:hypothetical protein